MAFSCSQVKERYTENAETKPEDIIGTWSNLSMKITYLDSDSIFDVPEGRWEEILKIKPILTTYSKDSTFISEYFKLDGSPLFTSEGTWFLKQDSLYLESEGTLTAYRFTMEDDIGQFVGILDWDSDGSENEHYLGRQKKHSDTP